MIFQATSPCLALPRLASTRPAMLPAALCVALAFSTASAHAQEAGLPASTSSTSSSLAQAGSVAQAQAAGEVSSGASNGASDTAGVSRGAVTVRPSGESYVTNDLRVAIVGATETGGNAALARRGMVAAYAAISVLPGYQNISPAEVADAMRATTLKRDALRVPEYAVLSKKVKADRTLSVTLRPGDSTATSATYSVVAELIDTRSGGLAGRGEGSYTATEGVADIATTSLRNVNANSVTPSASLARDVRAGRSASLQERAVDGAVARAIFDLNRPLSVQGAVLNKTARSDGKGAPYFARLSLGEMSGVRVGTPVEYLTPQGTSIGFGTIIDLAPGESLATVAPEAAYANLFVNCQVRTLDNPPLARAGQSAFVKDEREWARFERNFGIAAAIAGAAYLIAR